MPMGATMTASEVLGGGEEAPHESVMQAKLTEAVTAVLGFILATPSSPSSASSEGAADEEGTAKEATAAKEAKEAKEGTEGTEAEAEEGVVSRADLLAALQRLDMFSTAGAVDALGGVAAKEEPSGDWECTA